MATESELVKQRELNRDSYVKDLRLELVKKSIGNGIEFEDNFLLKFLRAKVYNLNDTSNLLKSYVSVFGLLPHFFEGVEFSRKPIENGMFHFLPDRNTTGERIANLRIGKWEPSQFSFESVCAATVYGFELAEMEEATQLNGAVEIIDCAGVGWKHFSQVGFKEMKLAALLSEQTFPIRWKKIFICNENYVVDVLYNVGKHFISKDLREKLEFIGTDFNRLHREIPKHLLPSRYGGTNEKDDPSQFMNELKRRESDLLKLWRPFKNLFKKKEEIKK